MVTLTVALPGSAGGTMMVAAMANGSVTSHDVSHFPLNWMAQAEPAAGAETSPVRATRTEMSSPGIPIGSGVTTRLSPAAAAAASVPSASVPPSIRTTPTIRARRVPSSISRLP